MRYVYIAGVFSSISKLWFSCRFIQNIHARNIGQKPEIAAGLMKMCVLLKISAAMTWAPRSEVCLWYSCVMDRAGNKIAVNAKAVRVFLLRVRVPLKAARHTQCF